MPEEIAIEDEIDSWIKLSKQNLTSIDCTAFDLLIRARQKILKQKIDHELLNNKYVDLVCIFLNVTQ